jgi:hypothetical protein
VSKIDQRPRTTRLQNPLATLLNKAPCFTLRRTRSMTPSGGFSLTTSSRGYAPMPCFATTVTIQRWVLQDLSSLTERTIPVTDNPFNITVAFSPRYWA